MIATVSWNVQNSMVLRFFPIFLASCLQLSGSLVLYIQGNETSFDFRLGVTSEIKFYVNDENHDGKEVRISVSHRPEDTKTSHMKCILTQSATGCNTTSDICICPEHNSSRNVFSLKKTFLQTDTGVWRFQSFSHCNESKIVKVKVHGASFII
ncbi:uncharacterized protein LOC112568309 [Pomacea canaliculata]|uniref:uncharacterized protein LOC112568309 n=1 Tax=Pomacea canaliculata TaxID=400727 RepID=UPI000D72A18F|nr:uncharacterized protein LOC112568309 [Pomacea canaliculata]